MIMSLCLLLQCRAQTIYGVTVTSIDRITDITESLGKLKKKPTTRIVFDEWIPASYYLDAVKQIRRVSFTMGEILDSWAMNQYNLAQYLERTDEYLNLLGDDIDIWEIGNEVNGEWLGNRSDVREKVEGAYRIVESQGKKTAITLFYNEFCFETESDIIYNWAEALPEEMKKGLDYVFVSYYPEDCAGYEPDWNLVFSRLSGIFTASKLGIGECGTENKKMKEQSMRKSYSLKVNMPNYIGGYFWWYYNSDCVPYSKPLWKTLNEAIGAP